MKTTEQEMREDLALIREMDIDRALAYFKNCLEIEFLQGGIQEINGALEDTNESS